MKKVCQNHVWDGHDTTLPSTTPFRGGETSMKAKQNKRQTERKGGASLGLNFTAIFSCAHKETINIIQNKH